MRAEFAEKRKSRTKGGVKSISQLALRHGASFFVSYFLTFSHGAEALGVGYLAGCDYRYFPAAFLGFVAKALLTKDIYASSPYVAAAGVIAATRWISFSFAKSRSKLSSAVAGCLSLIFTKAVTMLMLGDLSLAEVLMLAKDVLFVSLGTIAFSWNFKVSARSMKSRRAFICITAAVTAVIYSACGQNILYLSVGRVIAVIVCAFAIFTMPYKQACSAVIACGLGILLSETAFAFAAAGIVFSCLFCRAMDITEKWAGSLLLVLCLSLSSLFGSNYIYSAAFLCEAAIGCFIFTLLPTKSVISERQSLYESRLASAIKEHLNTASDAIKSIIPLIDRLNPDNGDCHISYSSVFAAAADKSCRYCPQMPECWIKGFNDTSDALDALSPFLLANGSVKQQDVPEPISSNCIALPELVDSINAAHSKSTLNTFRRHQESRAVSAVSKGLDIVSQMLDNLSNASDDMLTRDNDYSKPRFLMNYSVFQQSRCDKNGDIIKHTASKTGNNYLILSDGMGTGDNAAADSALCCDFASRLICSGLAEDIAIETANLLMSLRYTSESATAVDILAMDGHRGTAKIIKAGAAPSILLSGGCIKELWAESLPIGIMNDVQTAEFGLKLKADDVILLLSDGAAYKKNEIAETLKRSGNKTAEEICSEIRKLFPDSEIPDDITLVAVKIVENNI